MTKNNVITMANAKFGTVRKIVEGESVLYCGADIAKALGYGNPRDALARHCRGVVKRDAPTSSVVKHDAPISCGVQEMSFIPEADVYRLICHSKLPSAMEFEKWVFEDVVPKAVDKQIKPEYEQLTLETSEYHYFPKTLNGEPVITVADFAHFTGISSMPYKVLKKVCVYGEDWLALSSEEMSQFKRENPSIARNLSYIYVIKASGVKKLLKHFKLSVEIPMIEEKKQPPAKIKEPSSFIRPSSAMESLMSYIQREARAIDGVANMLLCPDTKENYESYRDLLIWRIKDLRNYCSDIELIKI